LIIIMSYNFLTAVLDIVLVCGSDRTIQVFDMNEGRVAAELPDSHSRAIHCITQNKGSMFSTQALDSYNLFLTSAVTDGVKLWDLRTLRCVRRYENHLNRCHPCSAAISPCGKFIASGSEDSYAYVYDVRSSSYLHKLQRHSDTVLSVTFNPAMPEVQSLHLFLNIDYKSFAYLELPLQGQCLQCLHQNLFKISTKLSGELCTEQQFPFDVFYCPVQDFSLELFKAHRFAKEIF
uniref:Uncharacterized protein n=1 Tax=Monopterus albus TaxID=43700 RepID=A0A3Q3IUY9_MONAL